MKGWFKDWEYMGTPISKPSKIIDKVPQYIIDTESKI